MKKLVLLITVLFIVTSCSNYGEKVSVKGTDVYYKDGVTKDEAQKLLDYLDKSEFVDGNEKSVQFVKDATSGNYVFRMIVSKSIVKDNSYDAVFKVFPTEISTAFDNKPVDLHLCDNTFKTLKIYLFKDAQKKLMAKLTEVRYTKNVTKEETQKLVDFLITSEFADDEIPKTIEFDKQDGNYLFRMVVKKDFEKDQKNINLLKFYVSTISAGAFDGKPVIAHMCNDKLQTIKVVQ